MMKIERIEHCRICGNKNLLTVVDLGIQVLSGRFPKAGTQDPVSTPLELVQCTGQNCCGLVQLAHHMPLGELYGEGYGYLSGLNQSMKKHLGDIAQMGERNVSLEKNDIVLDIGSNDGTLLKAYQRSDICRIGMDHKHFKKHYNDSNIIFIPEFFTKEIMFDDDKPKIITSIAMFYDLENPNKFVEDIKAILHPQGIWILEQAHLPQMLKQNAFDTIVSEHLEYYSLRQIEWLCRSHGLQIVHVEENDINGGSFLCIVTHDGFDFKGFNERIQNRKERLTQFLVDRKAEGKTVHLYGASTKVNVLLQYFQIDYRILSYAAERNKEKFGCKTPGTHIPIISEDESRKMNPDYYLVGPWHFRDSFISQMKEYMRQGGSLIFPLPNPEIISMENNKIIIKEV